MATLIPSYSSCVSRMTSGEKRFAQRLEAKLEDDYLCWYDVPIGQSMRHPDFIVLHPRRGLLILEVKDWKLDTIQSINKAWVTLLTYDGVKQRSNPLEQARQYAQAVANSLQKDCQLVFSSGKLRGQLLFPWSYGVILYRNWHPAGKTVRNALVTAGIPFSWKNDIQFNAQQDTVKLLTFHSSKGLEFQLVAIPDANMQAEEEKQDEEACLLYVAMTRATQELMVLERAG
ncbi:nuclease-related domain-containing protein [Nitrosomonas nitrosa]|nr:NERD domain-containing protein [Nitrosomonas nitrosa]